MNKKSRLFLIILSLFVCLLTSCGIPNYFGNVSNYAHFGGDYFYIDDKTLPDGFSTSQIEPKIMFLYMIYSDNQVNQLSTSSMEYKLQSQFRDDFKLADYDYKGCPNVGDKAVSTAEIKNTENPDHVDNVGLYQLKVMEQVSVPSSYTGYATNYSNEYLFNSDNMDFVRGSRYRFTFKLERVGETDDGQLVISCLNERGDVVAAYRMGNYRSEYFHTAYADRHSPDYDYAGTYNTKISILPVLYLESSEYNNRQMIIGSWQRVNLALEPLKKPDNTENKETVTP